MCSPTKIGRGITFDFETSPWSSDIRIELGTLRNTYFLISYDLRASLKPDLIRRNVGVERKVIHSRMQGFTMCRASYNLWHSVLGMLDLRFPFLGRTPVK